MDEYTAPTRAIGTALGALGIEQVLGWPAFGHVGRGDVDEVLDGFGRFASEVIAPTDRIGDTEGAIFDPESATVTSPLPLRHAYEEFVKAGWASLAFSAELGGGGLPNIVGLAAQEMFTAANMALSLNPMLTQGSIDLLSHWGTEVQRDAYLPRLITGEWTGTMNLTEPEAGSDVGAVRTRATSLGDGRWAISGTKIFITWGEHDLADNIVHLVLARTPGAPPGTKGISLFVVPKYVDPDADRAPAGTDGRTPATNGVRCLGIEHKLGIHASPTCVLEFDGAVGELVGPEHGGMAAMFTMMNAARLSIGLQGLAVSERAYQQSLAFACERRQGRAAGADPAAPSPIVDHPDVRRMLLTMASGIDAMRQLLYATAVATDAARHHPDPQARAAARARADLLTPVAKAWSTDEGVRLTSVAVQVHGGMGFVEETGIAQRYRDSRIAPIYEGTNGIQAIDLVSRKVLRDGGLAMSALVDDLIAGTEDLVAHPELLTVAPLVVDALTTLGEATAWLLGAAERSDDWLAAATAYLDLAGLAIAGGLLARQAVWARGHCLAEEANALVGRFRFFAIERLSTVPGLLVPITAGGARLSGSYLG